ncbi:Glucose-responsive transcription factor [Ptychographa xylographoides]|nr:Glucose-responsive transcription factor [Ptychographa xylographoides]
MSHNNSYPSPNAAQVGEGAGPFYAAQQTQRIPPQEDLELSVQLSREMAPGSNQGNSDHHDMQRVDQKFSQPIYTQHPMQNYQPQMNVTPQGQSSRAFVSQDNTPLEDSSARKKSKVSRACDECRRKKV